MSSKGGVTVAFRGYSVTESINVGNRAPEAEAREYREKEAEAAIGIRALAPDLQKIYDHYADGHHAYRKHRHLLDRDRAEVRSGDRKSSFRLPPAFRRGLQWPEMGLFIKEGVPEVLREKVLADLLLSQFAGGPLGSLYAEPHVDPTLALEERIVNVLDSQSLPPAWGVALARERELRRMLREAPAGPRYAALLLTSAVDRAPIPAEAFDLLDELPPVGEPSGPLATLLRFLPDAQWEAGIARIREDLGPLLRSDPRLQAWWAPVL